MAKTTTKKTTPRKTTKKRTSTKAVIKRVKTIPDNTDPGSLLQLAIKEKMDIDKLDKLLDIYQKWEAGKAKKKYFEALSRFQSRCPVIEKKKAGYNKRYYYAPLEDIIEQVKTLLDECGFSYTFTQNQENVGIIKITCHLHHLDGHTESATLEAHADTSGGKNAIQSIASTVTYLRRYTFCGITGITTADQDDDGQSYEPVLKNNKQVEDAELVYTKSEKKEPEKKDSICYQDIVKFINDHQKELFEKGVIPSEVLTNAKGSTPEELTIIYNKLKETL